MARGGVRKHPLIVKKPMCIKLPQWLLDWMREHSEETGESMAMLMEKALYKTYKLKPPQVEE